MRWNSEDRPQKEIARARALSDLGRLGSCLFLPAGGGFCVEKALSIGAIDLRTRLFFAERDESVAVEIRGGVMSKPWEVEPVLHVGELCDMVLPCNLDYAFLDFMGMLDRRVAFWMEGSLMPRLNPGASLALTFSFGRRNNQFPLEMDRILETKMPPVFHDEIYHLGKTPESILVNIAILKCVMSGYSFRIEKPWHYKDSRRSMVLYRLHNIRRDVASSYPRLNSLGVTMSEASVSCRSEAAYKSHETRRRNAEFDKRSAAATKAWETRRAMAVEASAEFDKRSAAATKAWETRRKAGIAYRESCGEPTAAAADTV
jgi:hypothetical protein